MQKRDIAKFVVNNLNGYAVSAAMRSYIRHGVPRTNNAALNILIDASVLTATWFTAGTLLEPVTKHTNQQIDNIADAISEFTPDKN